MKILLVAPHPFYQERGTPIAVRNLAQTLCQAGHSVDILTYHEGTDISVPGLRIFRIPNLMFIANIPIGLSWKKVVCDVFLSVKLLFLVRKEPYDIIHAVEESIYPSLIAKRMKKCLLIYDMDSSMADQVIEKWPFLKALSGLFYRFEKLAISGADGVFAVCDDLAMKAAAYCPSKPVIVVQDIPLESNGGHEVAEALRATCQVSGLLALYVGNLEHYQGIDLLLESFSNIPDQTDVALIIVGGNDKDIASYSRMSDELGLSERVFFLGPRPVALLSDYLAQADILLSPRLKGQNTPMKIYSYMAAGKAILATDIRSHTQVLDGTNSLLVRPSQSEFTDGLRQLCDSKSLRDKLGQAAKVVANSEYSLEAFRNKVADGYAKIQSSLTP